METMKSKAFGLFACLLLLMLTNQAWAVQVHGGTEGLVAHLIGHLLFILGMVYLLLRVKSLQLNGPGWLEFNAFLWLVIAWNILTFLGHCLHESMAKEKFIQADGRIVSFSITSFTDAWYYFFRLDHILLVPSFVFLLLALRKWRLQE